MDFVKWTLLIGFASNIAAILDRRASNITLERIRAWTPLTFFGDPSYCYINFALALTEDESIGTLLDKSWQTRAILFLRETTCVIESLKLKAIFSIDLDISDTMADFLEDHCYSDRLLD